MDVQSSTKSYRVQYSLGCPFNMQTYTFWLVIVTEDNLCWAPKVGKNLVAISADSMQHVCERHLCIDSNNHTLWCSIASKLGGGYAISLALCNYPCAWVSFVYRLKSQQTWSPWRQTHFTPSKSYSSNLLRQEPTVHNLSLTPKTSYTKGTPKIHQTTFPSQAFHTRNLWHQTPAWTGRLHMFCTEQLLTATTLFTRDLYIKNLSHQCSKRFYPNNVCTSTSIFIYICPKKVIAATTTLPYINNAYPTNRPHTCITPKIFDPIGLFWDQTSFTRFTRATFGGERLTAHRVGHQKPSALTTKIF